MIRPTLYPVTFVNTSTGSTEWSRVFQTIRAARKWANWLASQSYTTEVIVWRGEIGGDRALTVGGAA